MNGRREEGEEDQKQQEQNKQQYSSSTSSSESLPPPPAANPSAGNFPNVVIPARNPSVVFSGGGISFLTGNQIAKFSYGYSSFKGKRASMEDYYETGFQKLMDKWSWGPRTAKYLKNNLFKNLSSHPSFMRDTKSAIDEVFRQTDVDYLNEEKGNQKDAGSTSSTAVLVGDKLLVANVGDSRVVACRAGSAIPLSNDHKPDRSDERERIEQAGGFIVWAGTWRVGGVLAVSRAFGDKLLKPYVVADPEIQDAVGIVQDVTDAEAASRKLIEEAYSRGSSDNIACVVVRFENSVTLRSIYHCVSIPLSPCVSIPLSTFNVSANFSVRAPPFDR